MTMQPGRVYLVGAGPGDPGLISLRGIECLAAADVVLYDGLVNPLLLRHTGAHCERTCRSLTPDGHLLRQDQINERLVEEASRGKTVVRLKGGDPFIFGRGSEEAAYLREHHIEYEIIPGITAAVAAAEYAGLSLTHRDYASMVSFVTAHESPEKHSSRIDYRQLAELPGTLVFYMGLDRISQIVTSLIENGKQSSTPSAVISRATTPLQKTVSGPLSELPRLVSDAHLHAPSLIVVGECVQQREQLQWFESRPLLGQRIGITRPVDQADPQIARCIELGADPVLLPLIEIVPPDTWDEIDAVLDRLSDFDWLVFTSVNGVAGLLDRHWSRGGDMRSLAHMKFAAIGTSTAKALERFHIRPDLVPEEFRAESLAASLCPLVSGSRVLWAKASRGREILPRELAAAGAELTQLVVYQNRDVPEIRPEIISQIESGQLHWIGLSSPSIARNLSKLIPDSTRSCLGKSTQLVAISPVTAQAARESRLPVHLEASTYTWDGILSAIADA